MIIHGDALTELRKLPDESVNCCVTSPPYWGLRDYGVPGQLGLEKTPEEYVANLVAVFREVRRVLRDDGTAWINLGDSYANDGKWGGNSGGKHAKALHGNTGVGRQKVTTGLKPKDLCGIPWRVAFALQADGWYLRSDIIWSKPNPMPESVKDRPTRAHEYIFLFAKGQWKARIVEFSDLDSECMHFGQHIGTDSPFPWASGLCVRLATAIFDFAQRQENFGLPPFYAEIWKKGPDGRDSDFVRGLPSNRIPAVWASRFLDGDASTKEFLCEMNRWHIALCDSDKLLIGRIPAIFFDTPTLYADGKGAVTIQDSGKISKVDFVHNRIIASAPTICKYYYDAEAIKERISPASVARINQPSFDGQKGGPKDPRDGNRSHRKALENLATRNRDLRKTGVVPGKGEAHSHGTRTGVNLSGAYKGVDWSETGVNRRSVWTVATRPYAEAHFATFPPDLIEPCIKAGCPVGGVVLDPFFGAGTTGLVAMRLGREFIGIELNEKYCEIAKKRIYGGLF